MTLAFCHKTKNIITLKAYVAIQDKIIATKVSGKESIRFPLDWTIIALLEYLIKNLFDI